MNKIYLSPNLYFRKFKNLVNKTASLFIAAATMHTHTHTHIHSAQQVIKMFLTLRKNDSFKEMVHPKI